MEKIQPGKYVELTYKLYQVDPDGSETLVHESAPEDPERVIFGVTPGMIQPLEKAIDGLQPGGKFDLTVEAKDAFGPYDPEQVAELDKQVFEVDGKFDSEVITPGAVLPMMTADGFRINGKVLEVTDKHVKMDFNHPLAGKDVRFDGEVKTVRDATPEELTPASGCGCGNGCNCGDNCDCDSHDNCGCGGSCH